MHIGETELERSVRELLSQHPDEVGRVVHVLNGLQKRYGHISAAAIDVCARLFDIAPDSLSEIVRRFSGYKTKPDGKRVLEVCDGTACHAMGSSRLISLIERELGVQVGETTPDGQFTLRSVRCVGACALAPIVSVDGQTHGRVRPARLVEIMKEGA